MTSGRSSQHGELGFKLGDVRPQRLDGCGDLVTCPPWSDVLGAVPCSGDEVDDDTLFDSTPIGGARQHLEDGPVVDEAGMAIGLESSSRAVVDEEERDAVVV